MNQKNEGPPFPNATGSTENGKKNQTMVKNLRPISTPELIITNDVNQEKPLDYSLTKQKASHSFRGFKVKFSPRVKEKEEALNTSNSTLPKHNSNHKKRTSKEDAHPTLPKHHSMQHKSPTTGRDLGELLRRSFRSGKDESPIMISRYEVTSRSKYSGTVTPSAPQDDSITGKLQRDSSLTKSMPKRLKSLRVKNVFSGKPSRENSAKNVLEDAPPVLGSTEDRLKSSSELTTTFHDPQAGVPALQDQILVRKKEITSHLSQITSPPSFGDRGRNAIETDFKRNISNPLRQDRLALTRTSSLPNNTEHKVVLEDQKSLSTDIKSPLSSSSSSLTDEDFLSSFTDAQKARRQEFIMKLSVSAQDQPVENEWDHLQKFLALPTSQRTLRSKLMHPPAPTTPRSKNVGLIFHDGESSKSSSIFKAFGGPKPSTEPSLDRGKSITALDGTVVTLREGQDGSEIELLARSSKRLSISDKAALCKRESLYDMIDAIYAEDVEEKIILD